MKPIVKLHKSLLCMSAVLAAAFSLIVGPRAEAASYTFNTTAAGTYDWTSGTTWVGGVAAVSATDTAVTIFTDNTTPLPATGGTIYFSNSSGITLNTLNLNGLGATSGSSWFISLGNAGDNWTFDGTTPTINLFAKNGTKDVQYEFKTNLILNQDLTFTGDGTAGNGVGTGLRVTGTILDGSAPHGIVKTGSNRLYINGKNTFSGGTIFGGGQLWLASGSALGSGPVTITGTARQLLLNSSITVSNNITINASTGAGTASVGLIDTANNVNAVLTGGTLTINATPANGGHLGSGTGTATLTINDVINSSVTVNQRRGVIIYGGVGSSYAGLTVTGTAKLGANNGLATNATLDIGNQSASLFDMAGYSQSLVGLTKNTNTATVTNNGASDSTLTLTGVSTYAGTITDGATNKIGLVLSSGSLSLTGSNAYSGGTVISGGTLAMGNANALGTGTISLTGGVLQPGSNDISARLGTVGQQYNIDTNGTALTFATSFGGNAANSFAKFGANTLILSASNTFTGAVRIAAGMLQLGNANALNGNVVQLDSGATLRINSSPTIAGLNDNAGAGGTVDNTSAGAKTLTMNGAGIYSFNGVITGTTAGTTVNLSKTGSGTQTLSGTINTIGFTTLSGGTLALGNASTVLPSGNLTISGSATLDLGGSLTSSVGTVSLSAGGATLQNGNLTGSSYSVSNSSGSATITAGLLGTGTLTKSGNGGLVLGGSSAFSGGVSFTSGTLTASHNAALGTGTLSINTSARRFALSDGVNISNPIQLASATGITQQGLIENAGPGNATISGAITITGATTNGGHFGSPSGSLTLLGPITSSVEISQRRGTVIYGGGGSYANLVVNQGTAQLAANDGLSTSATVDIARNGSGTLDLAGYNQSLVGIVRTNTANTATIGNSSTSSDALLTLTGSSSFSGNIVDSLNTGTRKVAVTIASGTHTLSGAANTYTGATNVNAGTLIVSGSIAGSAFNVASGAILAGGNNLTSTIGALNAYGTVAPGNSGTTSANLGILNVNGDLTLGASGTTAHLVLELNGTTAGVGYDQIKMNGSTLNLTDVVLDGTLLNGYMPTQAATATTLDGDIFYLVIGAGARIGTFANQYAPVDWSNGFSTITLSGQEFLISYNATAGVSFSNGGNDIALMAIPEPNTWAMLISGLGTLVFVQRIRRRSTSL